MSFRDPFGRTFFEEHDALGRVVLNVAPGQHICDLCMAPNPTWEYPCGWVDLDGNPNMTASNDEWAVCDRCHELIEAGPDITALVDHIVERQLDGSSRLAAGFTLPDLYRVRRTAKKNLEAFLAARTGPARRFDG